MAASGAQRRLAGEPKARPDASFCPMYVRIVFLQFFANVYRTRQTIVPRGVPQPLLISPCPAWVLPTASDGSRPKTIVLP